MLPFEEVLVISLLLSLMIAVIYRLLTKPGEIRKTRKDISFYSNKMKEAQKSGNKAEADKYMSEMLKANQKVFKENMKPMFVTMIIFIVVLGVLKQAYSTFFLQLPFTLPLISYSFPFIVLRDSIGWFWWYILSTVPATLMFRKMLGVE